MQQAKAAVAALTDEERKDLSVVGITLDPMNDDVARLALMAEGQDIAAPLYRLCTGEPVAVEKLRDGLDVTRRRDPVSGVIDHANYFLVVDRAGRIAYRLTIGDRQQRWLTAALRTLILEGRVGS